jgi:hypothetical protein
VNTLNSLIAALIMSAPPVYIHPPPTVYLRPAAVACSAPVQQQPRSERGLACGDNATGQAVLFGLPSQRGLQ